MANDPEVSQRLQQLVSRFGYESVKQAFKALKPPKQARGRPRVKVYTWKTDRKYLLIAKERWEAANKPDTVWPYLVAAGERAYSDSRTASVESYAARFLGHLKDVALMMGEDLELEEFASNATDNRPMSQILSKVLDRIETPNPKELHKRLCCFILDDVRDDEVFNEMRDLGEIIERRKDIEGRLRIAELKPKK